MAGQSVEYRTLREKLTEAERLTRELAEHLDQGFRFKAHQLVRSLRDVERQPDDPKTLETVQDATVRQQAALLLESEEFTEEVFASLSTYCSSIDQEVSRIVMED